MQLPLQGKVISFDWSSTDKLLISDSNNLLLIYDLKKKTSIVTNLLFIPKFIIWHPQDCIALVTSSTELVLGTFYTSVDDLPKRILKLYQHKINHIARRFFHHLLRYHQFRKAFLLAVDLESQDLFLDLFHVAQQRVKMLLACVALHKANKFYSLQNSASNSSAVSGSSIDDTASEDGDWEDPVIQHYGNTGFETGSDTRYWLPESDKSNVNVSWLNSSETEMHIQQPFEKQYLHNGQFLKSNIYEQMSSYNRLSVDAEKSNCDKLHFVPTLNHRPSTFRSLFLLSQIF
ncbi:WD repeat-containing and planar cell polarity effector protein fritz [Caerostris extrusa]|uniref:WD repeat-containing and planar cell polarity effector protein fritz n=1 Tax=Caerostris extrusa TaxID=172846 RepID=A0AAV4U4E1_CAEEX|nr:WD repeat-containing and planar cell polarity effector protein fritz [Caerostris extrusa]